MEQFERDIQEQLKKLSCIEPSAQATEHAMVRVRAALAGEFAKKPGITERIVLFANRAKILKYAAAVLIVAVFGLALLVNDEVEPRAFAGVLGEMFKARSVRYNVTVTSQDAEPVKYCETVLEPGFVRRDLQNCYILEDINSGKKLSLFADSQAAHIERSIGRTRKVEQFNYIDWVTRLKEADLQYTGRVNYNGNLVDSYQWVSDSRKGEILLGAKDQLPVKIIVHTFSEWTDSIKPFVCVDSNDFGGGDVNVRGSRFSLSDAFVKTIEYDNFEWNIDIDPTFFSFEVPQGFGITEIQRDHNQVTQLYIVEVFAFWASVRDGQFPSEITEFITEGKKVVIEKFDREGDPYEELEDASVWIQKFVRVFGFAYEKELDGDWYYFGDEVRLGDSQKVLCAWKDYKSGMYNIVFGDMSVLESVTLEGYIEK